MKTSKVVRKAAEMMEQRDFEGNSHRMFSCNMVLLAAMELGVSHYNERYIEEYQQVYAPDSPNTGWAAWASRYPENKLEDLTADIVIDDSGRREKYIGWPPFNSDEGTHTRILALYLAAEWLESEGL